MAGHWVITALCSMQSMRGKPAGDNSYPIAGKWYELGGQPQQGSGIDIRRGSPVSDSLLLKNDDNRPAWMSALLRNSAVLWNVKMQAGKDGRKLACRSGQASLPTFSGGWCGLTRGWCYLVGELDFPAIAGSRSDAHEYIKMSY
jgi:hypothetical protein